MTIETVFIGLGSNLNEPVNQLNSAVARLKAMPDIRVLAVSSYYETAPMGYTDQPFFMNAVLKMETALDPFELLKRLKALELAQGRIPTFKNGPRSLDCDILLFGNQHIQTPELTIPHPGVWIRDFVLKPLKEIAPEVVVMA